nr:MAG TPA: hypothetical protein [Caudoviricetes sp.]
MGSVVAYILDFYTYILLKRENRKSPILLLF